MAQLNGACSALESANNPDQPEDLFDQIAAEMRFSPQSLMARLDRIRMLRMATFSSIAIEVGISRQRLWQFTRGNPEALDASQRRILDGVLSKCEFFFNVSQGQWWGVR